MRAIKNITNKKVEITLSFGSFLEDFLPNGHKLRAMSDIFGGKSMSGQGVYG